MPKFLADENLKRQITVGLRRRLPNIDLVTVQEEALAGVDDREVLSWAASRDRIVLTHDVNTMPGFAYERLAADRPMAGVIVIPDRLPIGDAIRDLASLETEQSTADWALQVLYLPLRLERPELGE